jgi:hypothetical protein
MMPTMPPLFTLGANLPMQGGMQVPTMGNMPPQMAPAPNLMQQPAQQPAAPPSLPQTLFGNLENGMSSPLFQAGIGLMSNGFPGLSQGLQAGLKMRNDREALPLERMLKEAQIEAYKAKATRGVEAPSNVREWEYFNRLSPDQQQQYLTMKRAEKYLDLGTGYGRPNPITGEVPTVVAKDLAGAEAQKAEGKATGDAQASLTSLQSKMPGLEAVVKELDDLSQKATYTVAGQATDYVRRQVGLDPREGAIARERYISMVNNQILPLLRDTFGAQFTQKEGESLKATLGDPNLSPPEKQAVLKSFIEQKRRDVEALAAQAGQSPAAASYQSASDGWTDIGGIKIRAKPSP